MSKVIEVNNISKQYLLGQIGTSSIAEDFKRYWQKIRSKDGQVLNHGQINDLSKKQDSNNPDYIWALKDISFNVETGDVVGIIGKNGAGKSTLLKILSKITSPSEGIIKVKGRIASLLEVGTGFHPDLSGRDNIYMNGAILGMKKIEIKRKFDEIVDFSGIERFVDTPIKRYSSGMYVRLAFAVAAHLEPEILIIDEVLAVGDREFQQKCFGKMENVSKGGRTILFVSHNLNALQRICNKGILLTQGRMSFQGSITDSINEYLSLTTFLDQKEYIQKDDISTPHFSYLKVELFGRQPELYIDISFKMKFSNKNDEPAFVIFILDNSQGESILYTVPNEEPFVSFIDSDKIFKCRVYLPVLIPGKYYISALAGPHRYVPYEHLREIISFEIIESPFPDGNNPHYESLGSLVSKSIMVND